MNKIQKERYKRHIILDEIGEPGQEKLLKASVLVVGAGGLGSPVLQYLTAAGVGNIGIVDGDVVSLSNLQRQVIYNETQIGQPKAQCAKEYLEKLNSDINIECFTDMLTEINAEEIVSKYEIVVGATDNFSSRILIDSMTKKLGIPFVHGSIGEFEGQVSVFNHKGGASYQELFPDTPDESTLSVGVMGVLPGIIGSMQAAEVIKLITGTGSILSGKLLVYNALSVSFQTLKIN